MKKIQSLVCVTARHREMLDQAFNLFEIKPDYYLNIMVSDQNFFEMTCNVVQGHQPILGQERPHIILV